MYDVIVIGAGPAGNIAACKLSQMQHKVVVVDLLERPGEKLCTGIVGRECVERYPPNEADIYREAQSSTVIAPSGKSHRIVKDEPQAYIIDRVAFVESLARRALEAGAVYRLGEKVVEIQRSNTGVTVRSTSPTGDRRYEARVAVIASGFSSPLLHMVGLKGVDHNDYMVGCQAEVSADHLEETEVYLGDAIAPGSFGWLVPLSGSRALLGIVSRRSLNGHMRGFMSALQQNGKVRSVIKEPTSWGIPIAPLPRTYGDRFTVVGDAGGFVKPTTGGGIYYAILSGEIAADTLHGAIAADDFSARQMKSYETSWKAVLGRELRIGYYARRFYESLGDDQVECLLEILLSSNIQRELISSSDFSFDWHSGFILKLLGHQRLGRAIGSFGPKVVQFLSR